MSRRVIGVRNGSCLERKYFHECRHLRGTSMISTPALLWEKIKSLYACNLSKGCEILYGLSYGVQCIGHTTSTTGRHHAPVFSSLIPCFRFCFPYEYTVALPVTQVYIYIYAMYIPHYCTGITFLSVCCWRFSHSLELEKLRFPSCTYMLRDYGSDQSFFRPVTDFCTHLSDV